MGEAFSTVLISSDLDDSALSAAGYAARAPAPGLKATVTVLAGDRDPRAPASDLDRQGGFGSAAEVQREIVWWLADSWRQGAG